MLLFGCFHYGETVEYCMYSGAFCCVLLHRTRDVSFTATENQMMKMEKMNLGQRFSR